MMRVQKKHAFSVLIATLSCVVSITLFSWLQILHSNSTQGISNNSSQLAFPVSADNAMSSKPVRVVVPEVGIDNQLEGGVYNAADNTWSLSPVNAQYAQTSAPANASSGNTFVYGHNSRNIFGRLAAIEQGDQAVLFTEDNLQFYYQLQSTAEVQPSDVEALDYVGPPILTIQTCSGSWNQRRHMFRFKLVRVELPPNYKA